MAARSSFGGLVEIALLPQRYAQGVVNVRLVGIEFSGFLQFNHRLGQFIFQFQRKAEIIVQGRIVRCGFQSSLKLCDGRIEIGLLQVRCPQVGAVTGVIGPQLKRGFERRNGAGRVTRLEQRQAQIVVRIGIVRTQVHELPEGRDRTWGIPRALQQHSKLGLGLDEIRLQLHCSSNFFDGLSWLARLFQARPR